MRKWDSTLRSERNFGCGFADYKYKIEDLTVRRNISVNPSTNPYDGTSAFLLTVMIKNNSSSKKNIHYSESVTSNYQVIQYQLTPKEELKVYYGNKVFTDKKQNYIKIENKSVSKDYEILNEEVCPYPMNGMKPLKVIDFVEKCFFFLKETIGSGEHGLIRLMNSDWNDTKHGSL